MSHYRTTSNHANPFKNREGFSKLCWEGNDEFEEDSEDSLIACVEMFLEDFFDRVPKELFVRCNPDTGGRYFKNSAKSTTYEVKDFEGVSLTIRYNHNSWDEREILVKGDVHFFVRYMDGDVYSFHLYSRGWW